MTVRLAFSPASHGPASWVASALAPSGITVDAVVPTGDGTTGAAPLLDSLATGAADAVLLRGPTPQALPSDFVRAAVLPREEPRDLLVVAQGAATPLRQLPAECRVGVTGARRRSLLRAHRPDVVTVPLENGSTPAQALEAGAVDAIVLGALEARQIGLATSAAEILDPKAWLPGPGQGATTIVTRVDDDVAEVLQVLNDADAEAALTTEIALMESLGVPPGSSLGVLAQPTGRWIRLWAAAASEDGRAMVRSDRTGPRDAPAVVVRAVATDLVERGLGRVLSEVDAH